MRNMLYSSVSAVAVLGTWLGTAPAALAAAGTQSETAAPAAAQVGTMPASPPAAATPETAEPRPSAGGGLEEIVVTAQKRSENLQRVPISVSVATASELKASGISGVQDLKIAAPGVEVQNQNGYAFPVIRGVGSKAAAPGLEPPVAIYVDGVYYATATSNLMSFNNIQQVEVLKGPQGTLFGRNATGGLIQITTRDPSRDLSGEFNVSYGNYESLKGDAYISGGLSDNVAADLAVNGTVMGDGYGTNLFNGRDVYKIEHDIAARSKWLFELGDDTSARLIFDYGSTRHNMNAARIGIGTIAPPPFGPAYAGSKWDINADEHPLIRNRQGGVSLRLDHDFEFVKIASITAYRRSKYEIDFDFDYTPTRGRVVDLEQKDSQFSQELQFLSPDGAAIKWVVGGYYFRANARYPFVNISFAGPAALPTMPPTVLSTTKSAQKNDSLSGFGQATIELVEGLSVTGGLRYTSEKRTLADASQVNTRADGSTVIAFPLTTRSRRFDKLTWRLAVDYQFTSDVLGYVSYNRGFKSGGYNPNVLILPAFLPEVLDSYEAGLKTSLFDRNVRLNLASFYYDYSNVQVQRTISGGTGIANGAKATIYGFEAEIEAQVTDALNLRIGYQYTNGEYDSFPSSVVATPRPAGGFFINNSGSATGNTTILSPKSTLSVAGSYEIPLERGRIVLNSTYYYNSGYYHEPDNVVRQPSYGLLNASVRWESDQGMSISVWGNNLTNEAVASYDGIQPFGATGARRTNYAPPRTYGLTLGYSF
ncbi:TonB-dependent receptor [Rhizorhabdus dicambivorans]|uniref:TonB-dependent receptor n=1 Tax=Rhizorhabdus dicambivorans TaxID=1850238 RepID=A0A2A4FP14_9SPHN|nr:TonB-dependent receptor [Rhizorhabdus dicambivorans]ATE65153.1 TonB-dependent receptor [Rhizorhabdus dicambivorans]PCE39897.1 TonB-dependent receptor [Rhizorhabdus dicambivorans]